MPYDRSKDSVIYTVKATDADAGESWIEVIIASYDGGENKLGINRCVEGKDGDTTYISCGRLTLPEARKVLVAMGQLLDLEPGPP